jgi:hypothetical protein
MSLKTIDEIQDEFDENERLSLSTIKDLRWYLENDPRPHRPIIIATDAGLTSLAPIIAKHLDHEDDFIREKAVGCLIGRLFQAQYAEKGLHMAKEDKYSNVRILAVSSLGAVIDDVDKNLRQEIADYLYYVLITPTYSKLYRQSAYDSILDAIRVPITEWPEVVVEPNIEELVDKELLAKFCKKYNVKMKA